MKKGFTLVELLVIIVILGLLGGIGATIFGNVQKQTKERLYQEQLSVIEKRIREYILENEGRTVTINGKSVKIDIYTENNTIELPISFLISEEYLDSYPINPKCNKKIEGYYLLKVTTKGSYDLEYHMSNNEETFCKV